MAAALAEVRTALLAADVHFKVAREFVERVQAQCAGQDVLKGVTPGQQIVKIIHDELVRLLGEGSTALEHGPAAQGHAGRPPRLGQDDLHRQAGRLLKKRGYRPFVVACDVYRPGGHRPAGDPRRARRNSASTPTAPPRTCPRSDARARGRRRRGRRRHPLRHRRPPPDRRGPDRGGAAASRTVVQPDEVLLVADGALGQEAVNVAKAFHDALQLTGLVLTKLDGDARGGAALSIKAITGIADQVRRHRREDRRLRRVLSRPAGLAHPRDGRRRLAGREGPGVDRRATRRSGWRRRCARPTSTWRTSSRRCSR